MADFSNLQSSHLNSDTPHHLPLEEEVRISSEQTLDHDSLTNCSNFVEKDDIVNVDDRDVPYIFNFDPFSPHNSSFFVPSSSSSSSYHHHHQQQQQVNSNSCSCCSSEPESEAESDRSDSIDHPDCLYGHDVEYEQELNSNSCSYCSSEPESESETETESADSTDYPDWLYGHDEEYDQMDFITDLFDSRGEIERGSTSDVGINVSEVDYFVSNNIEELGLGLGHEGGGGGGLRVARIESDSDTEELGEVVEQNDDRIQSTDLSLEHFWDCPSFDADRVDERDGLSSVIERIEEISVSSDGEATVGVLEWEILLAVNDLERDLEFATEGGDGFLYTPEFDTLIGQFVETVRALRGGPPAAKSIIDNLPLVALKMGDVKEGDGEICAVCKDEISMGEKVTQLPCKHVYHGECIVPWLSIRNTCPVCRFELPTDDVDYERSKHQENNDELQVGYGLDLLP